MASVAYQVCSLDEQVVRPGGGANGGMGEFAYEDIALVPPAAYGISAVNVEPDIVQPAALVADSEHDAGCGLVLGRK